ncbi:MAG: sugar phosphate isomerase/epimerase [Tepidisphaeraceae bacterium]|jgi:sugar phosphate isomerase/epimerase
MGFRNQVNDGTSNPPRLRLQQNAWGLSQLPRGGIEWSTPERLDKIAAAGFTGFEAACQGPQEADELAGVLRDRNLGIGFSTTATEADDLLPYIELAHRMRADYLTVQVPGSLMASPQIADLLEEMYELVNDAGLPLFVETHRGTVTQDLRRTVKVINRFKKVRFTGDFSHYVIAGELGGGWSDDIWDHFQQIARRCANWRGRISFGEQIQNDIGDGAGEPARQFKKLWTLGFSAWLEKARAGDVLPFGCQLGPVPYSLTDLSGREISDRWEQCLVIKRLAEEAWADAQPAQEPAEPQATDPNVSLR